MSNRNPQLVEITDRVGPALNAELVRRLQSAGHPALTLAHAKVFEHLGDGARITDLAERAQVTKQSMGELVRALEVLGYLLRIPDPCDGRAQLIRATPRGEDVMASSRAEIAAMYRLARRRLGARQMEQLERLLAGYEQVLEEWRTAAG